jgi:hypothetical protein
MSNPNDELTKGPGSCTHDCVTANPGRMAPGLEDLLRDNL